MLTNKYKIMIMTASVGYGHDQAAKVIKKHLLDKHDNLDIEIIDFIDIFPSTIGSLIKTTYLKMIDMVPSWYNLLYQGTMRLNQQSKVSSIFAHKYKKKVLTLIEASNPDVILFTNPFPSTLVSHLKRKNKINTYTASIITDYTAHSVWLDSTIDSYFVGSNILKQEMIDRGIEGSKIRVTGIPIEGKFNTPVNREEKMIELGLDVDVPTVLIMGGGLGLGSIEEVLKTTDKINKPLQLIVVAGKNQSLKEELENRIYNPKHNVKILGFCDNVHELMECSHLLVSKAGGLTMTEAVTKELPVLVFDPIPGQEVKNAQYFSDIGAAMYLKDLNEIRDAIEELLYESPQKREKMVKCCSVIRKPHAAEDVSKFILKKIDNRAFKKTPMIK
ncbi:glycosyltransferase [Alkaliphilus sp. MSJ-5]|uniref:Glycosyltransferase n=1 Tax=Alkaliphilus flagellatus TaxID=2841507 RepID=A0ABS6G0M1_9FIRM|nr:glycosyltransferase [Alkaliphilus flagellatus]MBU5676044.1 glycosyltransferase [Alkaliphilus flagellatus]